jgi:chromosome segregation ATPase
MLEHAVPERAELEKSKAEALAAVAEREKEAKRAKTFEEQLEYTRSQYQDRSNQISMLATSNDEYVKRIAELEVKASGEQARLKSINNDSLVKKYDSTIKQLRTVVAEREGTMQRMSEELTRLREPRGRVGTRASSIPRSPRAGTREPVSRQGSPSVQRPHPLRKEN